MERGLVVDATHNEFNNSLPAVATVQSGEVVTFDCPGPPLPPKATVQDLSNIDFSHPHTIAGPVAIAGAEPGDSLLIEILELKLPVPFGHCLFAPGVGLLPDEFDEAYVHSFQLAEGFAELKPGVRVPIEPFCGIMGLAPGEPGSHSTIPPRRVGGNLDIRDLTVGARLTLPVEVEGGLFSCGDGHAAQGDGEVCVTAIETAIMPTLRFTLLKSVDTNMPTFISPPARVERGGGGWFGTCAAGEDLLECTRQAVREMIEHLVEERGLSRQEAYVLCSIAVDLRISEVVNWPSYIVTAHLPLDLFA
jgi:acetamidase/formamidase